MLTRLSACQVRFPTKGTIALASGLPLLAPALSVAPCAVRQRLRAASSSGSRPSSIAIRTQEENASNPVALAAPRTSEVAVSHELMRALLMKVSSDLAHSAFCPSRGVTAESASWNATPGRLAVMLLSTFLNSAAARCEKEPANTSIPPQPALT